ncbi:HAD family phosphatase [Limnohabitans sp. Rim11]|jgi:HAD superfamily hydrolase (TIGR01490 family)|uniref:histidinol-phosphatase n=1 Tax=Limnohabitans sp. Rim11 TaxID=1100719 RepID=UPI000A7D8656|nr:HAD family hydrolase [Limnohabitans sp. Rim11]
MNLTLFDLDHTLLPIDSDYSWGEFSLKMGWVDPELFKAKNDQFFADYQAGVLDIHDYVKFATEAVRLKGPELAAKAHQQFMQEVVLPVIKPSALSLIKQHQDAGDHVMVVTATNEFVTRPIAKALGIQELIAVELAKDSTGWITGEILGTPSFKAGKVARVEAWLSAHQKSWQDVHITFYSDSLNDLPLLEKAQTPVATNPDARLRQLATDRGWRILELFT